MKLYKDNNGLWVVGGKIVPQGKSLLEVGDAITISIINSNSILFRGQIEELQKENGDSYADLDELLLECKDFFSNPLNDLVVDVEGLQQNKADLVSGKVPADQLPSYVDDVINIEYFSDTEPAALEDELWYDTVNHDLAVYDGEGWLAVDLEYGKIYVNVDSTSDEVNATYRYNGITLILIGKPITREIVESLTAVRTVNIAAYDVDMSLGEDFVKTLEADSAFTISNPVIKKPFRMFLTGGTIAATMFTGYTSTWIAGSLKSDYNPAVTNVLYCEIRETGVITLFWEV